MVDSPLKAQLKRDEGLRLFVYEDSRGIPTIGFGRNLSGKGISLDEANVLLDNDIAETRQDLAAALPWSLSLDDARQGVLMNLTFNIGIHGLLGFRNMLAALELADYEAAAREMESSAWAAQVGARAQRLIVQMRSGTWQ